MLQFFSYNMEIKQFEMVVTGTKVLNKSLYCHFNRS